MCAGASVHTTSTLPGGVEPVVRAGCPRGFDVALEAEEEAEVRDRVRQGVDLVDPVLMTARGGQETGSRSRVHQCPRSPPWRGCHRPRAVRTPTTRSSSVSSVSTLVFALRVSPPALVIVGRMCSAKAAATATDRIPGAALQVATRNQRVHREARLARPAAVIEPLGGEDGCEEGVVRDLVDHVLRRPGAPALYGSGCATTSARTRRAPGIARVGVIFMTAASLPSLERVRSMPRWRRPRPGIDPSRSRACASYGT